VEESASTNNSIADRASGEKVFNILKNTLKVDWRDYVVLVAHKLDGNPFAVLVAIILSQNTNDKNAIKAYMKLREKTSISPEKILSINKNELVETIRPAGLPKQKANAILELAKLVMRKGGNEWLSRGDPEEIRRELLKIPGIGKKTADVFLSFYRGYGGVFAVDTHAARIAKRWGLVSDRAGYDEISKALLRYFGPDKAEEAHRLLIALGRTYCKARNPRCDECPLRGLCPWPERRGLQVLQQRSLVESAGRSRNYGT